MKQAYIVGIVARTRVIVNITDGMTQDEINDIAIRQAVKRILSDAPGYIDGDNCIEIDPDEECPAGTFESD
jgi:hypothetical protein